ncbi:MAG: hypothetical protein HYX49_11380 [Chloroflexi bacterium]|nr:hypothetical protein [Chloroflexota bacterium]
MTRITFQRSGGFTGRTISLTLNLDDLPPDQASTLNRLLANANFFNLPADSAKRPVPDEFTYTVTVETGQQSHTIRTSDTSAPESLRPLLDDLSLRARTQRA